MKYNINDVLICKTTVFYHDSNHADDHEKFTIGEEYEILNKNSCGQYAIGGNCQSGLYWFLETQIDVYFKAKNAVDPYDHAMEIL